MSQQITAIEVFDKCAALYAERFMEFELYNDTFNAFSNNITTKNARILDVACGPGNITRYLLRQRPDFEVLGIDLAPNMVALAGAHNPTAEFQIMDARHIGTLKQQFDGVMCGFCLPYLSKEETTQFIADAAQLLQPGGILYLSTMEGDYWASGFKKASTGDEVYMYYHNADELVPVLALHGFTVLELWRKDFPGADGSTTVDLVVLARRK